jgi:hypothetical protein
MWLVLIAVAGVCSGWAIHATRCLRRAKRIDQALQIETRNVATLSANILQGEAVMSRLEDDIGRGKHANKPELVGLADQYKKALSNWRIRREDETRWVRMHADQVRKLQLAAIFPWLAVPVQGIEYSDRH